MQRLALGLLIPLCWFSGTCLAEDEADAKARHEAVAARRTHVQIICHRGASEFAHENTLEAYRATFELGGDGNEIDIRSTNDGVLVCFHDDMLDRLLLGYGDVSDYNWAELQQFAFHNPGRFADQCRIPTLEEVFELHRKYSGLMHLDIKRPGLDQAISGLLTRLDLWHHVIACNQETGGVILNDVRYKPSRYKGGLYLDHGEVFPEAIQACLDKPGDGVIVDDPRGVSVALKRKLGPVSRLPVSPKVRTAGPASQQTVAELIVRLDDAADWDMVAQLPEEQIASADRIRARAQAADRLLALRPTSADAFAALEQRVRQRSLHKEWMYQGLDGEKALRALLHLQAPNAVELSRVVLWTDDPALDAVVNPRFKNPRSWTDFRVKTAVFPALARFPSPASVKLCRDYLALTDEDANRLGPPQFEEAAQAMLAIQPDEAIVAELLRHRLPLVRGRAILDCLASSREPWAKAALKQSAPHALAYVVD